MVDDGAGPGRVVLGVVVGVAIAAAGVLVLALVGLAEADSAGRTSTGGGQLLGWTALAVGPVVGLRIGGVPWHRAAWAAPVLPAAVLLVRVAG